jgi:dicarboxylate transporter 10
MAGSGKLEDSQQPARAVVKKVHYPFWFGGSASCFAAMVTHPLDLGEYISQWLVGRILEGFN